MQYVAGRAMNVFKAVGMTVSIGLALTGTMWSQQSSVHWKGTWASSQQYDAAVSETASEAFTGTTLRQMIHISEGGKVMRLHISNAYGLTALKISAVHIAKPVSIPECKIDPASNVAVTFAGNTDVSIPPGAEYVSDPVSFDLAPLSDLAISLYLESPPAHQTGHPGSRTTSCIAKGNMVTAAQLSDARKIEKWFYISAVDVQSSASGGGSIVALGDSITDGHGTTTNGNDRWTDVLARRLQAVPAMAQWGVLNQGIGGNHILTDGIGQNVLARLDKDVLAQTGVRYVILLEGVNDLGGWTREAPISETEHARKVRELIAGLQQIILRAHARGLKVIGATILPYAGSDYYHPDGANEKDRQQVNAWIRTPGNFDAVVDLDAVIADPQHPDRMQQKFDSGDHLHPGPEGYKAIGDAFPLALFQ